jgi:hypothetical protein
MISQDLDKRFIDNQIELLKSTKSTIEGEFKTDDDKLKQCPTCGILIEKEDDSCLQMFCIICKTTWSWNTNKIVLENENKHNILSFKTEKKRKKLRFIDDPILDKLSRRIYKCIIALDKQEYRFNVELYLLRVSFISKDFDFETFKTKLLNAKYRNDSNNKLLESLVSIYNENLTTNFNVPDKLPFC